MRFGIMVVLLSNTTFLQCLAEIVPCTGTESCSLERRNGVGVRHSVAALYLPTCTMPKLCIALSKTPSLQLTRLPSTHPPTGRSEFGRVDVLVNDAAWNIGIPFTDLATLTADIRDLSWNESARSVLVGESMRSAPARAWGRSDREYCLAGRPVPGE